MYIYIYENHQSMMGPMAGVIPVKTPKRTPAAQLHILGQTVPGKSLAAAGATSSK